MFRQSVKCQKALDAIKDKNLDITQKHIPFQGGFVVICFVKQLIDNALLSQGVIKPLMRYCSGDSKGLNAAVSLEKVLYAADCKTDSDEGKVLDTILSGMAVILFSSDTQYVIVNLKSVAHRSVPTPEVEYAIRAPKDCFMENLDENLSLLRNRIKDKNLRIKTFDVGRRTKTKVAVIYIEDVANNTVVTELQNRIKGIDVDGIYESGELQEFLLNKKNDLFPQMGILERSDMAARHLLDGRVVTLVEGSGFALSAPITFNEFFYSCDDFYGNKYFAVFSRFIRYASLMIAFMSTSIYVAVSAFHTEVLPSLYAILLSEMRASVPFSSLIGALMLEFFMEIIRESLLRVPKNIGSAIGIVAAIVIGQAAISAGLFSALLLILASAGLLASFTIVDYTLINVFRMLKFLLLIATGAFGFYGFTLFILLVLSQLVSGSSFGIPYLAPYAPFNFKDFLRTFVDNRSIMPHRTGFLNNKNTRRLK